MKKQISFRPAMALLPSVLAAALLAGCATAGKDYAGPPAAAPAASFARAGDAAADGQVLARWWPALNDATLDGLVDAALKANPNLGVARARLRQARAALGTERANGRPNGTATAMAAHVRLPPLGDALGAGAESGAGAEGGAGGGFALPSSLNLYSVGFDATWEIDLFGGRRRAVEAAGAAADAAEAQLADAQLSLTAEVASAYINLRSVQQRIALSDAAIARQQRMLDLTARRVQAGTASQLDLTRLQGQLESTRADAEPLLSQLDAYRDELATLVGLAPGALDAQLAAAAPVPLPPASVATGDPAAMLKRRPDIRAAERTLAARSAQVGQADAARFPRLTLLGLIGIGGTHPSDLTHLDDFSAIAAPQLSWNFLDFGRNAARIEQAEGARDEAEAQYRVAVLGALRDAEGALSRFKQRRATVATVARAKAAAEHATELMAARQKAGTASLIDLLDTERQQIAAEQSLAQAQAALTGEFVALHKALGLGWQSDNPQATLPTGAP
ncbi:efflux transporter outer membrane subunit [Herbaspirillum sp. SJZ107]|uniref:efflux transporter outer membrane subunit n=1 Tax=Herbaspirillum sp. SJZ107 TaxID=2572881 RepID=UPI0011673813|nr:efflux transporter outer membrane subunit [Herbaspirillum sp. SJZ107]TQK11763.1 NodT family efflux transporter outer membrane factor (OMF) lipoprotein [Herbaspirillum sp. SJZ107]